MILCQIQIRSYLNNKMYLYTSLMNQKMNIDVSPYKPYERNTIQYERCRAGSV